MAISTGSVAPDFTLKTKTENGLEDITLSSFFGKENVVLLFFPAAFTGVCTQEMCDVSNGLHSMPNAKVFGISTDTPFAQEAWAKANKIGVTLLSDFGRKVSAGYNVLWENFAGTGGDSSYRAAFVIDKEGVIQYSEVTENPGVMPNFEAIQSTLAKI
ncbi:MAG: redoxin domain-containing protein [Armatimonadota bacterium]|jgi:peroxiredoxin